MLLAPPDVGNPLRVGKVEKMMGTAQESSLTSLVVSDQNIFSHVVLCSTLDPKLSGFDAGCKNLPKLVFALKLGTFCTRRVSRNPPFLLQDIDGQGWQGTGAIGHDIGFKRC